MSTNLHTNEEGESQDFASIMNRLNGSLQAMSDQRDELTAAHERHHATTKEHFEQLASYLEEQGPFIRPDVPFLRTSEYLMGMSGSERAKARAELLSVLQGQYALVVQQQSEFPGLSAPRLRVALEKVIAELRRQDEADEQDRARRERWQRARTGDVRVEMNNPTVSAELPADLPTMPESRRTVAKRAQVVVGVTR